jgi:glycosyltransferase involved in cell wall biosynthesis
MITLNMIIKNEAETLPNCLKSIKDFVDEIIVLDTGSTDDTVAIAVSFGASVQHFEWCNDFSAARNVALSYVRTPWTLWLDADDVVSNPEILKDLVKSAHKQRASAVWSHYRQDSVCNQRRLQLFKTKEYRWEGAVHESPVSRKASDTILSDLLVLHQKPLERCKSAARQYLAILLEKEPENWIGLAESYKYLAVHEDEDSIQNLLLADENFNQAWQWDQTNDDTKYICLFNMALLNIQLSDTFPERLLLAKRYAQAGVGIRPDRAECFSLLGHCLLEEGQPEKAKAALEHALTLDLPSGDIGLVYHQHYSTIPQQLLEVADKMLEVQRIERASRETILIYTPTE